MSLPFLFCFRKVSSSIITCRALGPLVVPHLDSTAQGVDRARNSTSSSICCGLLYRIPSAKLGLSFNSSYPLVMSSTKRHFATRATKLYHTDLGAAEAVELRRWGTWSSPRNVRQKQINQHFDLGRISRILDKIIFRGLLGNRVIFRWSKAPRGKLESKTTLISDVKRGPCTLIEVVKPLTNGPWTLAIIQEFLEATLFEMTEVFFLMYSRNCAPFQQANNQAWIGGLSRHEILPRKLWREVEKEANRTLKGFQRPWQLRSPCR